MEIPNIYTSEVYIISIVGREREWRIERSCKKLETYRVFRPCDEAADSTAKRME
jgi:hypothetical protein